MPEKRRLASLLLEKRLVSTQATDLLAKKAMQERSSLPGDVKSAPLHESTSHHFLRCFVRTGHIAHLLPQMMEQGRTCLLATQ